MEWYETEEGKQKLLEIINEKFIFLDGEPVERNNQPERSKREDLNEFTIMGSKECIALNAIPSDECNEYHKNSSIQINHEGKSYLMRCSEHDRNAVREVP